MRNVTNATIGIIAAALVAVSPLLWAQTAHAVAFTSRSITVGDATVSFSTTHTFEFQINSVDSVGSILFEYCTNTPFAGTNCDVPPGLDLTGVSLASQSGETGFSIDSTTPNSIVIGRAAGLTSTGPVSYRFNNAVNQSSPSSVYVRISSYASSDGSGSMIDNGAVVYAAVPRLSVSGYVPPYLTFCVGVSVSLNCSSATGTNLDFGELSSSQPRFVSSQFSIATNDPNGYSTTLAGSTMTSGNNIIPPNDTPKTSQPGVSQFGMNLRSNSSPAVGANPTGVGTGVIAPNFAIPNQYSFGNQVIVSSGVSTDFNLFTASYVVNVSGDQRPGVYSTTITYIAVAGF